MESEGVIDKNTQTRACNLTCANAYMKVGKRKSWGKLFSSIKITPFIAVFSLVSLSSAPIGQVWHSKYRRQNSGRGQDSTGDIITMDYRYSQEEVQCDEEAKCHQLLLPCRLKVGFTCINASLYRPAQSKVHSSCF